MAKRKQFPRWGGKGCDKSCCDGRQSDIKGDSGTGDESRGLAKEAGSTGQKSLPFAGHIKRPNWYKPGTVALRESVTTRNLLIFNY